MKQIFLFSNFFSVSQSEQQGEYTEGEGKISSGKSEINLIEEDHEYSQPRDFGETSSESVVNDLRSGKSRKKYF